MTPIQLEISYVDGHWIVRDPSTGFTRVRDNFPQAVETIASMMAGRGFGVDLCNVEGVVHGSQPADDDIGRIVERVGKPVVAQ